MSTLARGVVRGMRGDSHSYLLGTDDGHYYVTKLARSSNSPRRLVNEWVGSQLLSHLGLATPSVRIVETTAEFLDAHASKLSPIPTKPSALQRLHFGSQFPGDPASSSVYDYLPDRLLPRVENLDDFVGTLIFDLWCGRTTRRQAIFVRNKEHPGALRALMIDNGDLFGGAAWRLDEAAAPGLHISLSPYNKLKCLADVAPWLTKIQNIPESFFPSLASSVPQAWVAGDALALSGLLQQLSSRRRNLSSLALSCLRSSRKLFPSWMDDVPLQLGSAATISNASVGSQCSKTQDCSPHSPSCMLATH